MSGMFCRLFSTWLGKRETTCWRMSSVGISGVCMGVVCLSMKFLVDALVL